MGKQCRRSYPILLKAFFGVILFCCSSVKCDQESSLDYAIETSDQQYLFVMVKENQKPLFLDKYVQSGLYKNDGSVTPIWTIDWYGIAVPIDVNHLVGRGKWPRSGNYNEEAISFFFNGRLLKQYLVKDLIDFPWFLPKTVSHYKWLKLKPNSEVSLLLGDGAKYPFQSGILIDHTSQSIEIETLEGGIFLFDYNTGNTVYTKRPLRFKVILSVSIISLLFTMLIFIVLWKRKYSRHKIDVASPTPTPTTLTNL